jgi:two-component system phosphate regulon sensor histidine kinase PhoR
LKKIFLNNKILWQMILFCTTGYLSAIVVFIALLRYDIITKAGAAAGILSSGILLAGLLWVMYRVILEPLQRINKAARLMSRGNLEYKLYINTDDELGMLAGSLNAVTGRLKDALIQLRDATSLEQAILDSMTDGVIAVNGDGEVLFVNPVAEEILGVRQSSAVGKKIVEIVRSYEIEQIIESALKSRKHLTHEVKLLTPEVKVFRLQVTPLTLYEIGSSGVLILFHDNTERRKLDEMRSEFITNVSHELRTPLTSISGFVETLLGGAAEDPETTLRFLNIISKETRRITGLLDELLNLSKIEERRVVHRWQPVQLAENISRVTAMFLPRIEEKGLELNVDLPPELPAVYGDPDMLTQVLINLLDNAVKYTPAGGRITIRSLVDDTELRVEVEDTGIGIPPESLPRVFERFYRVDKARSRELGGIGVGLAIVKHIIRAHGGKTFVESKVGGGSVFSFALPIDADKQ